MPDKFRALATISAWVIFIVGMLSLVLAIVFMTGRSIDTSTTGVWCIVDTCLMMGVVSLTLSVCVMILRRKME